MTMVLSLRSYTLTKAAPRTSLQLESLIKDDQYQRPNTPAPYRLLRSIDLDDCSSLVALTKASKFTIMQANL